jgi:hypothetical protein
VKVVQRAVVSPHFSSDKCGSARVFASQIARDVAYTA